MRELCWTSRNKLYAVVVIFFILFIPHNASAATQQLKILIALQEFPIPTHTFVLRHIMDLMSRGHHVAVYSAKKPAHEDHVLIAAGLQNVQIFYGDVPEQLDFFDMIVCQFGISGIRFAALKKEGRFHGKLITFFRGCDISSYLYRAPQCYHELFRQGDLFIPVCNYFKTVLIEHGCPADKIVVSYSPIDCTHFTISTRDAASNPKTIKLLSVGRFVEKKGFITGIRAVAKALQEVPNLEYNLVGSGPQEQEIKKLIRELKVEKQVKILGHRHHHEIRQLLHQAHIFLAPSMTARNHDQEGIPDALKEAMAAGLLVISTQHSGIPEVVRHGESGLLVPEFDEHALAGAIVQACITHDCWPAYGAAARSIIEREHNAEIEYARLEDLFCNLVEQKKLHQECAASNTHTLKILFVVDTFPCQYHTFINNQLAGLLERGHEIDILAEQRGDFLSRELPAGKSLGNVFYKQPTRTQMPYDVIYCQFAYLLPRCLRLLQERKITGKLIVGLRGGDAGFVFAKDVQEREALFNQVDLFLPVSRYFHEKLLAAGCSPEKSLVLHSPIDCKQFPFVGIRMSAADDNTLRLITVCRLVEKKGLTYAIRAVAQLLHDYPQITYNIIGDGPLEGELSKLIEELNVQNNIRLLGAQSHHEVAAHLAASDIFILSSCTTSKGLEEGIANAPKEAMAIGVIAVCTDHSGTSELITDGINGFLVPEHDSEALYKKLSWVLAHRELWPTITSAARHTIEQNFALEDGIDHLENILIRLCFPSN